MTMAKKIFLYVTKYFFIDACLPFLVLYIKKLPCKAFKYFSLLFAHVDIILDGAPHYKTALFRQCFYRKFSFRYFKINCWKRLVKKMHAFALSFMDQKKKKIWKLTQSIFEHANENLHELVSISYIFWKFNAWNASDQNINWR